MIYKAETPDGYMSRLPEDRKQAMALLRQTVKESIPAGFEEVIQYDMISYVVPHRIYPAGYHVNPQDPLPFLSIASQKNHIALYHMGLYMIPDLLEWFMAEYPKHVKTKPDIGKSCIRFKNMKTIPYELIAELCRKVTPADYIENLPK